MASMLLALKHGMDSYSKSAKRMVQCNTVKAAYDGAKINNQKHQSPCGAAIRTLGAGALVVLAPPAAVGVMAVRDYQQQKLGESQKERIAAMASSLQSQGITPQGALEIANVVVKNGTTDHYLCMKDFAMWNLFCSRNPEFIQYHSKVAKRLETWRDQVDVS